MNDEQLKACRDAFEKWFEESQDLMTYQGLNPPDVFKRKKNGEYGWDVVDISFDAYQAAWESRPAVQVFAVEICPDCDIAGCKCIRARNSSRLDNSDLMRDMAFFINRVLAFGNNKDDFEREVPFGAKLLLRYAFVTTQKSTEPTLNKE